MQLTLHWLAITRRTAGDSALELAQLGLRRCLYLMREMDRTERSAPEASAMVSRAILETALVSSYLALHQGDAADRLLKKQASPARRVRDRFLRGELVAALGLFPDVEYLSGPLSPQLGATRSAPDLSQICAWLDGRPPFQTNQLATLLYEESYTALSNVVEHPTPASLERYRKGWRLIRLRRWRPVRSFPPDTLVHVAYPAVGALGAALATALGRGAADLESWAQEAATADGYTWTASPARSLAVQGLGEMVRIVPVWKLNLGGFAVRALAMSASFRAASPDEQLVAAAEVLERARRPPHLAATFLLSAKSKIRRRITEPYRSGGEGVRLAASGALASDPIGLVAAMALVFAATWPDDPTDTDQRLTAITQPVGPQLDGFVLSLSQADVVGMGSELKRQWNRWT